MGPGALVRQIPLPAFSTVSTRVEGECRRGVPCRGNLSCRVVCWGWLISSVCIVRMFQILSSVCSVPLSLHQTWFPSVAVRGGGSGLWIGAGTPPTLLKVKIQLTSWFTVPSNTS